MRSPSYASGLRKRTGLLVLVRSRYLWAATDTALCFRRRRIALHQKAELGPKDRYRPALRDTRDPRRLMIDLPGSPVVPVSELS
ncbi:MAG: hypothetical protein N2561_02625 [Bacteroidetes bacterium]|nr:hypothetical protein [Rhodothermia bacterium]MCS7155555.1 hypothetical protein [Bacteroidota bacterium]MCX7906413.1 hypothetical protein [Bacteroidota bacterium]MDW8137305.1 hypothetical protein [Bacteroidota bacterium]MDW8284825.1 hypothetical protein [Bacteroidota bacterium]